MTVPELDVGRNYDAVIVGSGATGGWCAKELSESGFDILVVDAGPILDPAVDFDLVKWTDAERQKQAIRQPVQSRVRVYWRSNPKLFVDDLDQPYSTEDNTSFSWIRSRSMGGRTLAWPGVVPRFSDYEFQAAKQDGYGPCWPFSYRDLAPCYDKVEAFLGVQGTNEALAQFPDGRFLAPPPLTPSEIRFKEIVEKKWPDRRVSSSRGITRSHDSAGDWPRRSSMGSTLRAALETGKTTLLGNTVVSRLLTDPATGKVKGLSCVDAKTGRAFEISGKATILCASSIESVRIMLNSRSDRHPTGVGNSSGLLGCYIMDHPTVVCFGGIPGVSPPAPAETEVAFGGPHSITIPKFRNVGSLHGGFLRGYGIWGGLQRGREAVDGCATFVLVALLEMLPRKENRVTLSATQKDELGIPSIHCNVTYSDNELNMAADAKESMREMIAAAGLTTKVETAELPPPGEFSHEAGGARMGTDPRESVLDPYNRCWDAENLFVLDGACFPTVGWQNPTLTMMAVAVRATERIVSTLRSGDLR